MSKRKASPLMPKATALWLIDNTSLTFEQIADFCELHPLEVQGIADGEVAKGIRPVNPIASGELTNEEIERCSKNAKEKLLINVRVNSLDAKLDKQKKATKYTPVARRQDKPNAVAWILENCPEMTDAQIVKLIGTTKNTITSIREGTNWNSANIIPKDPVLLGICSQSELNMAYEKAMKKAKALAEKNIEAGVATQEQVES